MDSSGSSTVIAPNHFIAFNNISFHWTGTLYNKNDSSWPCKEKDIQALKAALDSRFWFPKEGNLNNDDFDNSNSFFMQRDDTLNMDGIEIYVGHLLNTRMILLFSLNAIHLLASNLHQSGKTSKALPLPKALKQQSKEDGGIAKYERHFVTSGDELRSLKKKVEKHNKKLDHELSMTQWGGEYEEVRKVWQSSDKDFKPTFIGFDVETYENCHEDILEIGWSIVGPQQEQRTFHYLIEESYVEGLRNGRYVPDNRRNFLFGSIVEKPLVGSFPKWAPNGTEIAPLMDVGLRFAKVLKRARRKGPVYVVFHDSKGDMRVMNDLGIDTNEWSMNLFGDKKGRKIAAPSSSAHVSGDPSISKLIQDDDGKDSKDLHPVYILDTQLLFAALRCGGTGQKRGLQYICTGLNVNQGILESFHNAANDAHYTAAALLEMARGPHFSVMRELVEKRVDDKEKQSVVKPTTGKKGFAKSKMRTWSATSSSSSRF